MTRHLVSAQYWAGLAGGDTGRLFLTFGGPVRADRISYCPLDRVFTYKNLIYLLNLQFCYKQGVQGSFFTNVSVFMRNLIAYLVLTLTFEEGYNHTHSHGFFF